MDNPRHIIKSLFNPFYSHLKTATIKKAAIFSGFLAGLIVTFLIMLFVGVWVGLLGPLPKKEELLTIKNPTASEVYSADSVLLGRYFLQERSNILFANIPTHVVDAILVTEDVRFYNHDGIDVRSLGRVLIKSILFQQKSSGGGSTITQQLAKNLYPRKDYVLLSLLTNKIREMIIASRLEAVYNKNEILTLYLNTVPFGEETFGLEAASQRFFSIPARELTIDQGALLVGMLKATHPRIYPRKALDRRNVVLNQLSKYKNIPKKLSDSLKSLPIELKYNKITHHTGLAPYFREYLRIELLKWCEEYNQHHEQPINLYTDGLRIYTTIDSRLQQYGEEAMKRQMMATQKIFLNHWSKSDPWNHFPGMINDLVIRSERYQNLKKQGLAHADILAKMNKAIVMNVFTWEGEREVLMSPVDSIKHYLKFLIAGLLAMDPKQGAVRVWVGGINHHYFQFDHIRSSTKRQVGSIFKPIVYASALEQGIKPCSFISAEKTTYTNMEDWAPENTEDNYRLKYSMAGALAYSVNTVAVKMLEKAGIQNTLRVAQRMGITSPLKPVPSLALGTAEISMLEMVTAYTCFAKQGRIVKPFLLTSILSHEGELLEVFKPASSHRAISAESAELVLHMLRRAVNEGTSSSLRSRFKLPNDIAGKTGTTQSNTDGWFIGITPHLVVGAWVGADDPRIRFRSTALGQGARTALPIVGEFLRLTNGDVRLKSISRARFPELSASLERKIDCDLYKRENLFKRLFRNPNKNKKKEFGKKTKRGLF